MKISIIGSSGKVAKQIIYHAFTRNISTSLEIVLLSRHPNLVNSHILDSRTLDSLLTPAEYTEPKFKITSDYQDIAHSHTIFICVGRFMDQNKKEFFRSIDASGRLAHTFQNLDLIKEIVLQIKKHSPKSYVIIVTTQSDMLSAIARTVLNPSHVFGMGGMLDEARFRKILTLSLNNLTPEERHIRPRDVAVEIVGYHNNDMIAVKDSIQVPEYHKRILQGSPKLIEEALVATKNYGREISKHIDPRYPTMHLGAHIGPGAACWMTIAALTSQTPPVKASFNMVPNKDQENLYGIARGTHLSMPLLVGPNRFERLVSDYVCTGDEKEYIKLAATRMEDSVNKLLTAQVS